MTTRHGNLGSQQSPKQCDIAQLCHTLFAHENAIQGEVVYKVVGCVCLSADRSRDVLFLEHSGNRKGSKGIKKDQKGLTTETSAGSWSFSSGSGKKNLKCGDQIHQVSSTSMLPGCSKGVQALGCAKSCQQNDIKWSQTIFGVTTATPSVGETVSGGTAHLKTSMWLGSVPVYWDLLYKSIGNV